MILKKAILGLYNKMPLSVKHAFSGYNSVYNFYQKAQWWPIERIKEWQLQRLKELVDYAYYNTKGYRELYEQAGVSPADINTLDDIKFIPSVTKEQLRANIGSFTAPKNKAGHLCLGVTGGSSGHPFEFYYDLKNADAEYAFIENAWASVGWTPKSIGVILRGTYIGDASNIIIKKSSTVYSMSSIYLTDSTYERYMSAIEQVKATYLHVYPSTISDLSNLIISHNDMGRLKVKQIFLGSENFYSWQEELVRKAFPAATLFGWYGHSERAVFSPWCEKSQKYHLNPFYGFTELLNGNTEVSEGEVGEIVGTSFWMYGTLFIRYRTGDFAEKGPSICPDCGRQYQLMNYIDGRKAEIIVGRDGRRISLTVFAGSIMHGRSFEHIKQFRFYQDEIGKIILYIVPFTGYSKEDEVQIDQSMSKFLGDDFDYSIQTVDELKKSASGKFTYLEQHLKVDRSDYDK